MAKQLQLTHFAPLCALLLLAPLGVFATDVCGTGAAVDFPTKCWFNSDPAGRYVCCDQEGCDGFNADGNIPHCANNGYIPPNFGVPVSPCGDLCTSSSAPNRCCNADGSTGVCCPGSCGPSVHALGGTVATCLNNLPPGPTPPPKPTPPLGTTPPPGTTHPPGMTPPPPTTTHPTTPPVATEPPTCNCPDAIGTIPPEVYCHLIDWATAYKFNECPYKKDGFQLDTCFVSPQPPHYEMGALYCCIDQPPYDQLCGDGQSTCCLDHERGGVYCVPSLQEIYDYCSKTPAPTTPAPITPAPTTPAPTTPAPTTPAPTTPAPTTPAPTTPAPTTPAPTTPAPTTPAPTTPAPTTPAPTTPAPTTPAPTTPAPTTPAPTTPAPTTPAPTTPAPTTPAPTTPAPTTPAPTTPAPTTPAPTTPAPTTPAPTTPAPTTPAPTTPAPTTPAPTTPAPTTPAPTTPAPTTPAPTTPAPTTPAPTTPAPTTPAPTTPAPTTPAPTTPAPTTPAPTTPAPTTPAPTTPAPTTPAPTPTNPPGICTVDGALGVCQSNCGNGNSGCNCLDVQYLTGMCVDCNAGVTGLPGNDQCVGLGGVPAISNGRNLCQPGGTQPCVLDTTCNNAGGNQCEKIDGDEGKCCHF